ncbi:recombinase family protein [Candidatus Bathyarchaeota archaeon]|nr:recombinase family protein [Candidatus Bathyarchaeota archaeon]
MKNNIETQNDLIKLLYPELLSDSQPSKKSKNIRYVLYARKSTDDPERQTKSLPDQIFECEKFAKDNNLKIIKTVQEKKSAKEPDIRPKFREMLDKIENGVYDGILAWHPDRLARNMREAGEIIDLIDKGIIEDLKFTSFSFENNPSGKMLLGIGFVLAKHYSEKLGVDVSRGLGRGIKEGKVFENKHGYYKDKNNFLWPDGKNFDILVEAWNLKLRGRTNVEISEFINKRGYQRAKGKGKNVKRIDFQMSHKKLSELFRDPFYTGVHKYGDNFANLVDIYDFTPMVSVKAFKAINKLNNINKAFRTRVRGYREGQRIAEFLNGKVICSECNKPKIAGVTPKRLKNGTIRRYFYYRCETDKCKLKDKSTRAKVITDFVYEFLDQHSFASKEMYKNYKEEIDKMKANRIRELKSELNVVNRRIRDENEKISNIKQLIIKEQKDETIREEFKDDLKEEKKRLAKYLTQKGEIKSLIRKCENINITFAKFLELFKKLPEILRKTRSLNKKDKIIRKIFLNFTVNQKKVLSYKLNSPFKEFMERQKKAKITKSRGSRT